jgi:protein SCO1/2
MRISIYLFVFFLSLTCSAPEKAYPVKGTIYGILPDSMKVTIAHDTIPNLMMPMVMPFNLKNRKDIDGLSIGDSVHFDFVWEDTVTYAKNFRIAGKGTLPEDDDGFFDDEYSVKRIGQTLDNVTLLDLDSSRVQLSDSDGRYRFISFIFTQCPMPNMCPAVVIKNNYLAESFSDYENIDFIMVSFDYKYDTPTVLKEFYGSTILGHNNWQVWSSTGRIDDVYRLVKQSGGDFWGIEEGRIGHTLSSVLIGPDRVVLGFWPGDDWKAGDVKNAIELLMK